MKRFYRVLFVAFVAFALAACGPGPKSQQLDDLERQLQDPSAKDVKDAPGASKPYREARQYRRLSLEAWEEGKEEISQEYAVLGLLRYRTAVAINEQHAAKARLDKANAAVGDTNPEIKALNNEQIKLAEDVRQLEMQVAQQRRMKEEADRRASAMASQQNMQSGQNDPGMRQTIQAKLTEARTAKSAADAVNAQTHAPAQYNPAENTLKTVEMMLANNQVGQPALAEAEKARSLFVAAKNEAEPKYKVELEKQNPSLRRNSLRTDAENMFGGSNVVSEPAGARIVFPGSFDKGSSTVAASKRGLFEQLGDLAASYDDFTIYVEGYTSAGDATENLGLSQLRARAVKDILVGKGVKSTRIETRGQGQEKQRYSGTQNDRVEVVLSR